MEAHTSVVITDVRIPFWSAVVIILKFTLAAIPAMFVIWAIGAALTFIAMALFGGLALLGGAAGS